jgi:hypothetical protein
MTRRYNLIVIHTPTHQDISDFLTIQHFMLWRAPDIELSIFSTDKGCPEAFWRKAAERPSVLFSPFMARIPAAARGARLVSTPLTKWAELQVLRDAGAPVPETRGIMPEMRLDEAQWGPFTVVKPNVGLQGKGVRLVRTSNVRWLDTSALPKDHPWYDNKLLAQRYISTGPYAKCYRVMTVLGRPIYCAVSTAAEERPEPGSSFDGEIGVAPNSGVRTMALSNERDVIDLATAIHSKLPRLPVMAIDIIREQESGRLFALEFNSPGYSWHLSSDHGRKLQRDYNVNYYEQFDALNTITDALIAASRKYAV